MIAQYPNRHLSQEQRCQWAGLLPDTADEIGRTGRFATWRRRGSECADAQMGTG